MKIDVCCCSSCRCFFYRRFFYGCSGRCSRWCSPPPAIKTKKADKHATSTCKLLKLAAPTQSTSLSMLVDEVRLCPTICLLFFIFLLVLFWFYGLIQAGSIKLTPSLFTDSGHIQCNILSYSPPSWWLQTRFQPAARPISIDLGDLILVQPGNDFFFFFGLVGLKFGKECSSRWPRLIYHRLRCVSFESRVVEIVCINPSAVGHRQVHFEWFQCLSNLLHMLVEMQTAIKE